MAAPRTKHPLRQVLFWAVFILLGLVFGVVALVLLFLMAHDPIRDPKGWGEANASVIYRARYVIASHFAAHRQLPEDLQSVLESQRLHKSVFGRPFTVRARSDGVTVEIVDLGRDGVVGGTSADKDWSGVFRADLPLGRDFADSGAWIKDPADDIGS